MVEDFVRGKNHYIICVDKTFVAKSGEVFCDKTHIDIKEYRAKTTALWKTRESRTCIMRAEGRSEGEISI